MTNKFEHYIFSNINSLWSHDHAFMFDKIDSRRFCPKWLLGRHRLFDCFTYPSVLAQTESNFKFVITMHSDTQDKFKSLFEDYTSSSVDILYSDQPPRVSIPNYIRKKTSTPWVITSNIDSDDAVSIDYVADTQAMFSEQVELLNPLFGWRHYLGESVFYRRKYNRCPFASLVEPTSSAVGIHAEEHLKRHRIAPARHMTDKEYWIQVFHGENLRNLVITEKNTACEYEDIKDRFVIKMRGD